VLSFLIADNFKETGLPLSELRGRSLAGDPDMMQTLLERAIERGEIRRARLSPRLAPLPVDLVRHDLIITQSPVPDATLLEIVDKIFLPLIRG
jgi:hypothetical protein